MPGSSASLDSMYSRIIAIYTLHCDIEQAESNVQSSIPMADIAARIRGSHNTFTSTERSLRYIVSTSTLSPGWQHSSVNPGGNPANILYKLSTLMP